MCGDEMTERDAQLREIWQRWVKQAADAAGVSVEEIERRLAAGEGELEIRAIVQKPTEPA